MKKIFPLLLCLFALLSCEDDDSNSLCNLTVQLTSEKSEIKLNGFEVSITDLKSGHVQSSTSDETGVAVFQIPMGSYSITAELKKDGVCTYYGRQENYTVGNPEATVSVAVAPIESMLDKTFVLDELYFNGNSNGDYDYTYYEQYFTIRNVSDQPLFADGLSFGITGDLNIIDEKNEMNALLPDIVVLSQFYTIPGDGTTYKVEPGESLVVAFSAINHKEGGDKPNSLDLSGADFEIFVQGGMTANNPEVPDMIVNYTAFQAFSWQYSGASPVVLFRLKEDSESFINKNKQEFFNPASSGTMRQDFIKLPTELIIDAVETCVADELYHKVLPNTVDRSAIGIPGTGMLGDGFYGHFIQRKQITENGKNTVQDTNDSENDFELKTGGAKNYPKK